MTRSRLISLAFCLCLALLGATQLPLARRVAAYANQPVQDPQDPIPASPPLAEPLNLEQSAQQPTSRDAEMARALAPGETAQQDAYLSVGDGTGEVGYFQDGLIMLNRLTPAVYPCRLDFVDIYFGQFQNRPNPSGQPITLLIYLDPSGSGQLPTNPEFIRLEARIKSSDGKVNSYAVYNGPTINSGDFYVGYQVGTPHNGAHFFADANSTDQQRTFFSTNNGASFSRLAPSTGRTSANLMVEAYVRSFPQALQPTVSQVAPNGAEAFAKGGTLTVTGTNFVTGSRVMFNGAFITTTFVSATQLRAQLRADDLQTAGTAKVSVRNVGAVDSNQLNFTITPSTFPQAELEPNQSFEMADALPLPSTRTGTAAASDESIGLRPDFSNVNVHDIYSFRITRPAAVRFTLQWIDAAADLDMYVVKEGGVSTPSLINPLSGGGLNDTGGALPTSFVNAPFTPTAEAFVRNELEPGRYLVFIRARTGGSAYTLTVSTPTLGIVNAASYETRSLASDSIAAVFGAKLATGTAPAATLPLPTQLAGTTVRVKDSVGIERLAPLFFVSPEQINLLLPAEIAAGIAEVTVTSGDGTTTTDRILVHRLGPGLFTANASGAGAPAGVVLRVKADGTQSYESLTRIDTSVNPPRIVPASIDLGPEGETVFLVLYGTGFRNRSALDATGVWFYKLATSSSEVKVQPLYVGPAGDFAGLDQINVAIPRTLRGYGLTTIYGYADNQYFSRFYPSSTYIEIK